NAASANSVVIPRGRGVTSTPRRAGSITSASGVLDRRLSRAMPAQVDRDAFAQALIRTLNMRQTLSAVIASASAKQSMARHRRSLPLSSLRKQGPILRGLAVWARWLTAFAPRNACGVAMSALRSRGGVPAPVRNCALGRDEERETHLRVLAARCVR